MLRRPVWLLGFACMGLAASRFQALALHDGALAVVQPLLTTEMLFVVLILWAWYAVPRAGPGLARSPRSPSAASRCSSSALAPTNEGHAPTGPDRGSRRSSPSALAVLALVVRRAPRAALVARARPRRRGERRLRDDRGAHEGLLGRVRPGARPRVLDLADLRAVRRRARARSSSCRTRSTRGRSPRRQSTLILVNPFVSVGLGALALRRVVPPRRRASSRPGVVAVAASSSPGRSGCARRRSSRASTAPTTVQLLHGPRAARRRRAGPRGRPRAAHRASSGVARARHRGAPREVRRAPSSATPSRHDSSTTSKSEPTIPSSSWSWSLFHCARRHAREVPGRAVVRHDHPVGLERLEDDPVDPRVPRDVDGRLQAQAQPHRRQRRRRRRRPRGVRAR